MRFKDSKRSFAYSPTTVPSNIFAPRPFAKPKKAGSDDISAPSSLPQGDGMIQRASFTITVNGTEHTVNTEELTEKELRLIRKKYPDHAGTINDALSGKRYLDYRKHHRSGDSEGESEAGDLVIRPHERRYYRALSKLDKPKEGIKSRGVQNDDVNEDLDPTAHVINGQLAKTPYISATYSKSRASVYSISGEQPSNKMIEFIMPSEDFLDLIMDSSVRDKLGGPQQNTAKRDMEVLVWKNIEPEHITAIFKTKEIGPKEYDQYKAENEEQKKRGKEKKYEIYKRRDKYEDEYKYIFSEEEERKKSATLPIRKPSRFFAGELEAYGRIVKKFENKGVDLSGLRRPSGNLKTNSQLTEYIKELKAFVPPDSHEKMIESRDQGDYQDLSMETKIKKLDPGQVELKKKQKEEQKQKEKERREEERNKDDHFSTGPSGSNSYKKFKSGS